MRASALSRLALFFGTGVVVGGVVVVGAGCSDAPKVNIEQPNAPPPPPPAAVDDHAHDPEAAEAAPNDGKDHRALYVDRVAAADRNFVVDAAGALETAPQPCAPTTKLPAGPKMPSVCAVVDVGTPTPGLLVGRADGSLHYSARNDGVFVVVRDPRPAE